MSPPLRLRDLFADYRPDWPGAKFAEYFVEPTYFGTLEQPRPCFLFGGRGTGKTTALRSLRFDVAFERLNPPATEEAYLRAIPYLGLYVRMNKNHVLTFAGPENTDSEWARIFVHYFNLLAGLEFCELIAWVSERAPNLSLPSSVALRQIGTALAITSSDDSARSLEDAILHATIELELYANNPQSTRRPVLSSAETSLRLMASSVVGLDWARQKTMYCCIDEYENLRSHQQSALNTYIKHTRAPLSYKIGVRSAGLHSHATIDSADQLRTPEDYVSVDIARNEFEPFAEKVAEVRLGRARKLGLNVAPSLREFLPGLTLEAEAELLGVRKVAAEVMTVAKDIEGAVNLLERWPQLKVALVRFWHDAHPGTTLDALVREAVRHPDEWSQRYDNYAHASLFWLSRGRRGARLKKYYAGSGTALLMASGNIRYFLELLDKGIVTAISDAGDDYVHPLDGPPFSISPAAQTHAARSVGYSRLEQLEGVSEIGVRLKRLVLGIGKVFFEYARAPEPHSPERNSFVLGGKPESVQQVSGLLHEGASHLAFEVAPRTKATTALEPKDDEYRLHPIYAAFFEYSHRKKRRVTFDADGLLLLVDDPPAGMRSILHQEQAEANDLPTQLALFAPFFHGLGGSRPPT